MRNLLLFLTTILLIGSAFTFKGDSKTFPKIDAFTLSGKRVAIPDKAKPKFTLVGIAYSVEAQDALYTWAQPVYSSLVDNPFFPIHIYFVAMTGKIKVMSQDKIKAKMKESLDPELYKYVVLYQDDPKDFIETLAMSDKNTPYFFVIDPKGEITHTESGEFTDEKMEKITDALSE